MRVTLVHAEIQAAVVAMLAKRGVNIEGQDIAVAFSMGRKNTGLSATVDIVDPSIVHLPDAVVDEDDDPTPAAPAAAPATKVEAKEVKNTFVAKADDAGTVTVAKDEAKEDPLPVAKAEEDPPFDVDEPATSAASTASADASGASEAASAPAEDAPKKTTQSLFAQ